MIDTNHFFGPKTSQRGLFVLSSLTQTHSHSLFSLYHRIHRPSTITTMRTMISMNSPTQIIHPFSLHHPKYITMSCRHTGNGEAIAAASYLRPHERESIHQSINPNELNRPHDSTITTILERSTNAPYHTGPRGRYPCTIQANGQVIYPPTHPKSQRSTLYLRSLFYLRTRCPIEAIIS
jgi:hypothetical protein